MGSVKNVTWSLVLGLAVLALVRPVLNITGFADDVGKPGTPIVVTILISLVWIAAVGFSRVAQPLLTLVFTGIAYGVLAIILSGILSPILLGELHGPLANPVSIVGVLMANALWGVITGAFAVGIRSLRNEPVT